jgi:hypothetical protein
MTNRIAGAATTVAARWRWRKAASLTDLANLRADRIAHKLTLLPVDDRGPKWQMYTALAALGRAGVVLLDSRPGMFAYIDDLNTSLETRACVTGFADTATKDTLDNLHQAGYKSWGTDANIHFDVIELWAPGCEEYDRFGGADSRRWQGQPVERIDGVTTYRIGGQLDAGQVYRAFPTRRSLQVELRKAWQITICASTWGDGRMFDDLLALLHGRRPAAT